MLQSLSLRQAGTCRRDPTPSAHSSDGSESSGDSSAHRAGLAHRRRPPAGRAALKGRRWSASARLRPRRRPPPPPRRRRPPPPGRRRSRPPARAGCRRRRRRACARRGPESGGGHSRTSAGQPLLPLRPSGPTARPRQGRGSRAAAWRSRGGADGCGRYRGEKPRWRVSERSSGGGQAPLAWAEAAAVRRGRRIAGD